MKIGSYAKIGLLSYLILTVLTLSGCRGTGTPSLSEKNGTEAACSKVAATEDIFHPTRQWPHENSDLEPDPNAVFQTLPNGFRYVLMKNSRPENRVSMHLFIQAGAMHETETERGAAHFLEHMLFNGSENFPPGELVKYFQRIGMRFGPDANAHTGFYNTVYDIDLPEGDAKSLSEGLLVMKDYASGALISEAEVERERPIILAEKRTRDSADYRTFEATFAFELPDALLSRRLPIGTEDAIKAADRNLLKSFYDAWYRPDRMIFVMAGDFDMAAARALINDTFAALTPRAPLRPYPDPGFIHHDGDKAFYHYEPESGNTSICIETIAWEPTPADSRDRQKKALHAALANHIINQRLTEMLQDPETPFTQAMISSGHYLNFVKGADISADCAPENWDRTLTAIEQVLRRALTYGFTASEVDLAKKTFYAGLDKAVKTASTRESRDLSGQILHSLGSKQVFQSPDQNKALKAPVIDEATPEDLHAALKNDWDTGNRLILVTGNTDLKAPDKSPAHQVLEAYKASRAIDVPAPEEKQAMAFPYLPVPVQKAKIVLREDIDDLGIIHVEFENGVRLYVKPTDFKANEIQAAVIFGGGEKTEPMEKPGLSAISRKVLPLSGLGRLTRDELKRALTGKNTYVRFDVNEDHFMLSGSSISDEVALLFELFHAHLVDPGFRQDAYDLALSQLAQEYDALKHSISGGMVFEGARFLAGGDTRFGLPDFDTLKQNTLADIEGWISPALASADLEISIVGDLDPETVIDLAAVYLGSLPLRSNKNGDGHDSRQPVFPNGKSLSVSVPTVIPKAMVTVAWPTDDFRDNYRNRRFSVLSEIVSDRMRLKIREQMGASYTAYAYNNPSRAYHGYGVFATVVQADPEDTGKIVDTLKDIAGDVMEKGIDKDELERAVSPILASIRERVKTNEYWLESVLKRASRHPAQLDWARSFLTDYAAITKEDLTALARRYLDPGQAAAVVIFPEPTDPSSPADHSAP